jgi:hypothetical protein
VPLRPRLGPVYPGSIQAAFTALVGGVVGSMVKDPVAGTAFVTATAPASVCKVARIIDDDLTSAEVTSTSVLFAAFLSCSPEPSRLAVPARCDCVGAASNPNLRFRARAAPSFTDLLRQAGSGALSSPQR